MWLGPPYMNRKNDALGLRREVRGFRLERIFPGSGSIGGDRLLTQKSIVSQQARQGNARESAPGLPEELSPCAPAKVSALHRSPSTTGQRLSGGSQDVSRSSIAIKEPLIQIHKLVQIQCDQAIVLEGLPGAD